MHLRDNLLGIGHTRVHCASQSYRFAGRRSARRVDLAQTIFLIAKAQAALGRVGASLREGPLEVGGRMSLAPYRLFSRLLEGDYAPKVMAHTI